ncbi:hypothetical protein C3489_06920 [Streptomyces sp. Ru71]|nr:hypothetical protein C3489_06920 [Streptomyces sp. Ru71]
MDYPRTRALAEELDAYAQGLPGAWTVEIGPSGPVLAMRRASKRREGVIRRTREQLDALLPQTHPGCVCANGPVIEDPAIGRMRRPDAVVIPESVLDEEGLAVDATRVPAAIEIVSPSNPNNDYGEKLADYPAMGIPHVGVPALRQGRRRLRVLECVSAVRRGGGAAVLDWPLSTPLAHKDIRGSRGYCGDFGAERGTCGRYRVAGGLARRGTRACRPGAPDRSHARSARARSRTRHPDRGARHRRHGHRTGHLLAHLARPSAPQ